MDSYDTNVENVMTFLRSNQYSASVFNQHKNCYKAMRSFLQENNLEYSDQSVAEWLKMIQCTLNQRQYASAKHCMAQLRDMYCHGCILPGHLGPQASAYALLLPEAKAEVDEFISSRRNNLCSDACRIACSRFMLYLQHQGILSVRQLTYEMLFSFHKEDDHRSSKTKDVYENHVRALLKYHAKHGRCSSGFGLAMNKQLIPQIIRAYCSDFRQSPGDEDMNWPSVETFLLRMKQNRYSKTVLKSSKHTLSLLYIFLDMHSLRLNQSVLWRWFELAKPVLGTGWKQARRTLSQYWVYLETNVLTTKVTGNPHAVVAFDLLPDWCRLELQDYLYLLKREGRQDSTRTLCRSSNLRFCNYLIRLGVSSFSELTPQHLQAFNLLDRHNTAEGKAACNSKIRGFLGYLIERGLIDNPHLSRAIPSACAPRTELVEVLSREEVQQIWSVNASMLSSRALRDYAIVCIGLGMGFRASDIAALRYQDIDWAKHSISLVQQKTGKIVSLPMPTRVGNALFLYLKDGRPQSDSPYVFIGHKVPYDKLERGVCCRALKRFIPKQMKPGQGFHIVRKTFATNMLRGNARIERIADALGHSSGDTVSTYLSLDEERMKLCPLPLANLEICYKGGDLDA